MLGPCPVPEKASSNKSKIRNNTDEEKPNSVSCPNKSWERKFRLTVLPGEGNGGKSNYTTLGNNSGRGNRNRGSMPTVLKMKMREKRHAWGGGGGWGGWGGGGGGTFCYKAVGGQEYQAPALHLGRQGGPVKRQMKTGLSQMNFVWDV